jgi:hypothetical protein
VLFNLDNDESGPSVVGSLNLSFLGIILRVLRLEVSVYTIKMFTLKTSFKTL